MLSSEATSDRMRRHYWIPAPIVVALGLSLLGGLLLGLVLRPEGWTGWLTWTAAQGTLCLLLIYWLTRRTEQANLPLQQACNELQDETLTLLDSQAAWILTPGSLRAFKEMAASVDKRLVELRQHRDELTRSRGLLETVLQNMVEGVVVLTRDARIAFVNRSARTLLRLGNRDLVSRPFWEVARYAELSRQVSTALETARPSTEEVDLPQWRLSVRSSCIPLDLEEKAGAVLFLYDVTELRKLERQRREFVSNVSHELKTPLTAIQNYVDTLLDGALDDATHAPRFLAGIQEQSDRLEEMIQELLRLSRIESGEEVFNQVMVSIEPVIQESFALHQSLADAKSLQLELAGPRDDIQLWTDPRALRTILDNLINNAVKYTPAGGSVRVAWEVQQHELRIDIKDSGIGIPRDHLERIFERFYRVDRSRNRAVGGTGLGLAIVKHLVQELGGRIEVESTVEQGSKFSVWLPLSAGSTSETGEPARQSDEAALAPALPRTSEE